jgi:Domain of Unknown Function (DUF748)
MFSRWAGFATHSSSPRRTHRWPRRIMIGSVALLVFFALLLVASTFVVPYAIKSYAPKWVKEKTNRALSLEDASFNPFTLSLKVEKLLLKDATRTLGAFDQLVVKGSWSSITHAAWMTDSITLTNPQINAHIAKDGSLDWERFINAFPTSKRPQKNDDSIARIVLQDISIVGGAVHLTDERVGISAAAQKRVELAPLTFKLDKLSTLPRDRGDYALDATLNDQTRVQWKGRIGANPIESSGDLSITNLPLARVSSLANVLLPVELGGTAALKANYTVAVGADFFAAGVGGGTLQVNDLKVAQNKDEANVKAVVVAPLSFSYARTQSGDAKSKPQTLFAVEPFKATLDDANASARDAKEPFVSFSQLSTPSPNVVDVSNNKIVVSKIIVNKLKSQFSRAINGEVAIPFTSSPSSSEKSGADAHAIAQKTATSAASSESKPWRISIAEFVSDDASIVIDDASFATPQVANAKLAFSFGAEVELATTPKVRLTTERVQLSELSLRDSDGAGEKKPSWLAVKEARMHPFTFASDAEKIELPKIDIVAPQITASYSNTGFDLAKKLSAAAASLPTKSSMTHKEKPITLAGVAISNGRVNFTDASLAVPVTHTLQDIHIATERFVVNGAQPMSATINATLVSGGTLQSKIKFDPRAGSGDVDFAIDKLVLAALSPYLNRNTKLKIAKGEAAANGKLIFVSGAKADESIRIEGAAALRDVDLIDETTNTSFAQWAELSTSDARVSVGSQGTQIALADLLLDQPRGKIIIGEDRRVNLTQIEKLDAGGTPIQPKDTSTASAPQDSTKKTKLNAWRIQIAGADIEFADLSLRPQFGTRISDLSGLIVGLSTDASTRAEVSMEGKVDQFGLARLTGTIAPFGASEFTDLKAIFRNLEMANLTPYSGKFAGRKIESGKLSLNLEYKIEARKLKGENQVIIDNIKLGERVDSPEATNLPLDLAIALMRDSNGVIDLGIPVQGSLDDPQFSYGSLMWKAIVNVLTKIATAPFRALGALLGGSGEEFEAVIFEPGEARLLPPEREKLAKLAKALEQRPQLKLTIEPRFDKTADRDALADNIVKLDIGKRAGMKPPGANEPLVISFTDPKVQAALDELAMSAGDDAAILRAKYLPPASNAITGLIQNARERVTEKGRNELAEARGKYYPELFALLKSKQSVPEFAFEALATLRGQAIANTVTGVSKFDAARVSVAAPSAAKAVREGHVPTQLALSATP